MSQIRNIKRLIKEDFSKEDQELIDKLAYTINPFLDQVVAAFNKGINIDNLSREYVTITVQNNATAESYLVNGISTGGTLNVSVEIKTKLTARMVGINVIKSDNLTDPGVYPLNAPWLSWSVEKNIITINKITGLQDGSKYNLVLELIS